ncbi:MAG: hypothetical protein KAS23_07580 [Anaerohalosphaera sp.]|nr:hypothetical protein [Anaerohalosphaera sp.]
MKLDIKSAIIGLLLGIIIMITSGASSGGGGASFGFAIPSGCKALVKDQHGQALLIDPDTGKADLLIYKKPPANAPNYPSPSNGYELRLN